MKIQRVKKKQARICAAVSAGLGLAMVASACGSASRSANQGASVAGKSAPVTITLEGPNQWNTQTSSFGTPWNNLVAAFEKKNPGITVKTEVLPLSSFSQTESIQLAAGTAPDLMFDQATYQLSAVLSLDKYLKEPNPYIPGNKQWIDAFNPKYYGFDVAAALDGKGQITEIPFNEVTVGVYYNKTAFAKAGITAPIKTWADFAADAAKLKAAGYIPFSMQSGSLEVGWLEDVIFNMLAHNKYSEWNYFNAQGAPGSNPQLTTKDMDRAIVTGSLNASLPSVTETLKLTKEFLQKWSTPNWSGVTDSGGGSVTALTDFYDGKAAMTFGTDYAQGALQGVSFKYGTMPFPTITRATTSVSTDAPAQFGISGVGGTAYMIPSTTKGASLAASLKFLQFVTSPEGNAAWIKATGALPIVKGVPVPRAETGLLEGAWGQPKTIPAFPGGAGANTNEVITEGYLLGDKSLSSEESFLDQQWKQAAEYDIKKNGWGNEAWTKG